ncbi:STAS domain-containing protein [Peribacillus saganii]|uniref:STAS domain-containing protein n=1 Tax=Peribacillus saganii TaxID=2303992 RepID=A0A372LPF0_9BACI|nr:STAS domain-containing protein [Peribacillus saganii]RFU68977.1 STAS domain-containing protein [Peribacillus saganii]
MNSFSKVANYLTIHAESLAIRVVDDIVQRLELALSKEDLKYYYSVYTDFITFSAEGLTLNEYEVPPGFLEMSQKNGERQAALKGRISGIIGRYPQIRFGLIEQISKVSLKHGVTTEEAIEINKRVNYMLDTTVTQTILAFERQTDSVIDERERELIEKQKAINELSAPIVPIHDGIAILPLIGNIEPERVEHIFNRVIPEIPRLKVKYLIMDFSGILTIDTYVASQLFKINDVLRLLGINMVFTGIRPDLSIKSVTAGIDFSSIKTYASVLQAIEVIK